MSQLDYSSQSLSEERTTSRTGFKAKNKCSTRQKPEIPGGGRNPSMSTFNHFISNSFPQARQFFLLKENKQLMLQKLPMP